MDDNPAEPRGRTVRVSGGAALLVLFGSLRLWGVSAPTLWNDEIISIALARRSWYGLIHGALSDRVHPPLFYALLKVWIAIGGEGVVWLRLLPLSFAFLALVPAVLLCRELRLSRRAEALAVFLIATSGFLIRYAQELRMYSLVQLLSLTSLWLFARWVRRPARDPWTAAGLAAANAFLVLTHYYGWLLVASQGLYVLVRYRAKAVRFVLLSLPSATAFAPWAALVWRRIAEPAGLDRNLAGLSAPGLADVLGFFGGAAGPLVEDDPSLARIGVGILAFAVPVGLHLWRTFAARAVLPTAAPAPAQADRRSAAAFLAWFALFPVAVSVSVSLLARPVFHPRYLTIAVVPYIVLAAASLEALRPPKLAAGWTAVAAGWALIGSIAELADGGRPAWGEIAAGMRAGPCATAPAAEDRPTPVYVIGRRSVRPVRYYLESDRRFGVVPVTGPEQILGDEAWVAFHSSDGARVVPGAWASWQDVPAEDVRNAVTKRGYRIACELRSGDHATTGYVVKLERQPAP